MGFQIANASVILFYLMSYGRPLEGVEVFYNDCKLAYVIHVDGPI